MWYCFGEVDELLFAGVLLKFTICCVVSFW